MWSVHFTIVGLSRYRPSEMLNLTYRGGPLECGLRRVFNDLPIGSMLIQSEASTGEPLLLHLQLPICIRERHLAQNAWVFLLDAQVSRLCFSAPFQ